MLRNYFISEKTYSNDSLSLIFKKPEPLFSSFDNKKDQKNIRKIRRKSNQVALKPSLAKENYLVNFSNVFQSSNESVISRKTPCNTLKKIQIKDINFPDSLNFSTGSVQKVKKIGFFRRNRDPMKSANENSMNIFHSINKDVTHETEKNLEVTPSNKILSPTDAEFVKNSVIPARQRRCSTPIKQIPQKTMENDLNISAISYISPSPGNYLSSSNSSSNSVITSVFNNKQVSKNNSVPAFENSVSSRHTNTSIQFLNTSKNNVKDTGSCSLTSSNSLSFVTKIFGIQNNLTESVSQPSQTFKKVSKTRVIKRTKSQFIKKPKFPKFGFFCNKRFYQYLINKIESKYGISTNRKVVKVAEYINNIVKKILKMKENYHEEINKMKLFLVRRNVIYTHLDFYHFCMKFLPNQFVLKVVPTIQPFGQRMLEEFNLNSLFDPI